MMITCCKDIYKSYKIGVSNLKPAKMSPTLKTICLLRVVTYIIIKCIVSSMQQVWLFGDKYQFLTLFTITIKIVMWVIYISLIR